MARIAIFIPGQGKRLIDARFESIFNATYPCYLGMRFLECVHFYSEQGRTMQSVAPFQMRNVALDEKERAMNRRFQVARVYTKDI